MNTTIRKIGPGDRTLVSLFSEIAKAARGAALPLLIATSLGLLTSAYAHEYEQFVYETLDNGEAKVTGLTNAGKDAEMLSIPETINDIPVTRIAGYAMSGAKCYGITIPNSVNSEFREIYRRLCLL